MEITVVLAEEIDVALALLTEDERELVLRRFKEITAYDLLIDIEDLWKAELLTPEFDVERVKRLAAAYRMLGVDDDELKNARALLKRAGHGTDPDPEADD